MTAGTALATSRGCVIRVAVPVDFGLDGKSYGGPGRVYQLEVSINGCRVTVDGDLYKFKKDGTVGKASSSLAYNAFTLATLPPEIATCVREAYREWVASIPQDLP